MKLLAAIITDATVAFWTRDSDNLAPAEPVATVVNHGMTVDQVTDLGISLVEALGLNGVKPAPAPRAPRAASTPRKKAPVKRRGAGRAYFTSDEVLADIQANPGTTAHEGVVRLGQLNDEGSRQAYNRHAGELRKAGRVEIGPVRESGLRGRNPQTYVPTNGRSVAPVTPDAQEPPAEWPGAPEVTLSVEE